MDTKNMSLDDIIKSDRAKRKGQRRGGSRPPRGGG